MHLAELGVSFMGFSTAGELYYPGPFSVMVTAIFLIFPEGGICGAAQVVVSMMSMSAPLLGDGRGTFSISEDLNCPWALCFVLLWAADHCLYRTSTHPARGQACLSCYPPLPVHTILGPCWWLCCGAP